MKSFRKPISKQEEKMYRYLFNENLDQKKEYQNLLKFIILAQNKYTEPKDTIKHQKLYDCRQILGRWRCRT
jgi:hypothetical protein